MQHVPCPIFGPIPVTAKVGFAAADVIVELEPRFLVIAGERRGAVRLGDDGEPAFYQVVPLRHGTSAVECAASIRDGVLEIAVPLRANACVH